MARTITVAGAWCLAVSALLMFAGAASADQPVQPSCTVCTAIADLGCFPFSGSSAALFCDRGTITVSSGQEVEVGTEHEICGVKIGIKIKQSAGLAFSFNVGPCKECSAGICYPAARVETRTCYRKIVTEWDCDEVRSCGIMRCRPQSWRWEPYTVARISDYGAPLVAPICKDASNTCEELGLGNCGGDWDDDDLYRSVGVAPQTLAPPIVLLDVRQFANMGSSVDDVPLIGLEVLSLAQLETVARLVEDEISDAQYSRATVMVGLTFVGGFGGIETYAAWRARYLDALQARTAPERVADANGDGIFDTSDLFLVFDSMDAASLGGPWSSAADVDGDEAPTILDACRIVEAGTGSPLLPEP